MRIAKVVAAVAGCGGLLLLAVLASGGVTQHDTVLQFGQITVKIANWEPGVALGKFLILGLSFILLAWASDVLPHRAQPSSD